jgi:hypothetical protein
MNLIELVIIIVAFTLSIELGQHFSRYGWWTMIPAYCFGLVIAVVAVSSVVAEVRRHISLRREASSSKQENEV